MSNVTMALWKTKSLLGRFRLSVSHQPNSYGIGRVPVVCNLCETPESRAKHWFHSTNNQLGVYPKHNLIANIITKITKSRDSEAYMAVNIWVWYSGSYDQVVMKPNTVGLASVL